MRFILALTCLLISVCAKSQSSFPFKNISVNNGLSHTDATSVIQDENGFIWIATYSGLNRYDGYQIKKFYNQTNSYKAGYLNRINRIILGPNHSIILSTEAGLAYFDREQLKFLNPTATTQNAKSRLSDHYLDIKWFDGKLYAIRSDLSVQKFAFESGKFSLVKDSFLLNKKVKHIETIDDAYLLVNTPEANYIIDKNDKIKKVTGAKEQVTFSDFSYDRNQKSIYLFHRTSAKEFVSRLTKQSLIKYFNTRGTQFTSEIIQELNGYEIFKIRSFNNNLFCATINGLVVFTSGSDAKKGIRLLQTSDVNDQSISSNHISDLFRDSTGCLWISTFGGGISKLNLFQKQFYSIRKTPAVPGSSISSNYIRAISGRGNDELYIGTRSNGLNIYNLKSQDVSSITTNSRSSPLSSDHIRSLFRDNKGRLWVGTVKGLDLLLPPFGTSAKKIISHKGSDNSNDAIYSITMDNHGKIWAGGWGRGLYIITPGADGKFKLDSINTGTRLKGAGLASNKISFLFADSASNSMFVSTDHGLDQFFLTNTGEISHVRSYNRDENNNRFSSNFVWSVVKTSPNTYFVATLGGGLNKLELQKDRYRITPVNINGQKMMQDVESMLADDRGNLWLAGNTLYKYHIKSNSFTNYDVNDGLQGNNFKVGASYRAKDGTLFFGGTNGINYFYADSIRSNNNPNFKLIFTDLIINGQVVNPGKEPFQNIPKSLPFLETLELNYLQNNFIIRFSSTHFINPQNCKFKYMLKGFDRDWNLADAENRSAVYANLDYGSYTLIVEGTNSDGVWSSNPLYLKITVSPPWWKSLIAKVMYSIIAIAAVYFGYRYYLRWYQLKKTLKLNMLEEKKKEELHQLRLQFFTNISHEFRTPLTLILGPTEKLLNEGTPVEEKNKYLHLIFSNASRLLNLINELMDFRSVETDMLKLQIQDGNLGQLVNDISAEFLEFAKARNIKYEYPIGSEMKYFFDPNVIEKILVNLLSNAFKYSQGNDTIKVEVIEDKMLFTPEYQNHHFIQSKDRSKNYVWISVTDTGVGISDFSIKNIFDRYYRITESDESKHLGSGVGLALVRSLVLLHKGDIHVYSERNKGTQFLIGLPATTEVYQPDDFSVNSESHQINLENIYYTVDWNGSEYKSMQQEAETSFQTFRDSNSKKILIVEDNKEMREFLFDSLKDDYFVVTAVDGSEGLTKAQEINPDLIISDLMMPHLNGKEFCKAIKSDIETSHIPFILITAKANTDSQLEGAEVGADVYFSKPFSIKLLHLTIKNLFEARNRIKVRYSENALVEARELVNNSKDKQFLDTLIDIIERNLEQPELDVDFIANEICMSRTKLYGKIKGITGQPVGEFIRLFRLKRAAKILVSEDVTVSETMYRVGILSQSYFTKAFKKEFGKTPSQFIQSYNKDKDNKQ